MSNRMSFPGLDENARSGISRRPVCSGYHGMARIEIADEKSNMTPEEKNEQLSAVLTETDFRMLYITTIIREENTQEDKGQWVVFFI